MTVKVGESNELMNEVYHIQIQKSALFYDLVENNWHYQV